jgi:rhamnose utilization protein RhaD (predicted bifunctional aldolase and dehydrogenase)
MNRTAAARNSFPDIGSVLAPLVRLSARVGRDPLLVQASSGNTSIKLDGVLWIKASGKWMADADRHEMFVPISLAEAREQLERHTDLVVDAAPSAAQPMSAPIETFMHAVVPHRVVVHVHSVNAIAWAVRQDAQSELAQRLSGLRWHWIPYVPSGRPLAREMEKVASRRPDTDVVVLGNHGLVICGEDCNAVEDLLGEVERRLAIVPRRAPMARRGLLEQLACISPWRLPEMEAVHALGTDATSRRILRGGVLYPCQAIFLGQPAPMMPCSVPVSDVRDGVGGQYVHRPFLIVEGSGVMLSQKITHAELAVLSGLVEVVQRIGPSAPVRYLTPSDAADVLSGAGVSYRASAENNQSASAISQECFPPGPWNGAELSR